MKLSAPTKPVFIVSLVFAVLGLLGFFGVVAPVAAHSFWLMTIAYVVLAVACALKGL
ncbi:MAG: hypothetical protein MPN21_07920 [Thermoanaerobaculia bacterium]|nr:hypothetical protein [Thermoanaerobaculia bacterium]